jgi:hypothetical protein
MAGAQNSFFGAREKELNALNPARVDAASKLAFRSDAELDF